MLLRRVVSNLLDNAARAADVPPIGPWGSREPRDDRVTVRVVDHGAGLDAAARSQLFLPFARLDERETTHGPGLGGSAHRREGVPDPDGGRFWLEDTPGGGATFVFSLPEAG